MPSLHRRTERHKNNQESEVAQQKVKLSRDSLTKFAVSLLVEKTHEFSMKIFTSKALVSAGSRLARKIAASPTFSVAASMSGLQCICHPGVTMGAPSLDGGSSSSNITRYSHDAADISGYIDDDLDAYDFGYRVVYPSDARRYTTTVRMSGHSWQEATHFDEHYTAPSYDTAPVTTSDLGNADVVSDTLAFDCISDIVEAQREWDVAIHKEVPCVHFEHMKEDPFLCEYEAARVQENYSDDERFAENVFQGNEVSCGDKYVAADLQQHCIH